MIAASMMLSVGQETVHVVIFKAGCIYIRLHSPHVTVYPTVYYQIY